MTWKTGSWWAVAFLVALLSACDDGKTGPQGEPGEPGEAASCSVSDNGDGTKTVSCSDGTEVTLEDGGDGAPGAAGPAGPTGPAGTACTVHDNGNGTKTISCGDGTSVVVADGVSGAPGMDGMNGKSCAVRDNGDGTKTIACQDGSSAVVADGKDGANGQGALITSFHGTALLMSIGEYAEGKFLADAKITAASADEAGKVTLQFTLKRKDGTPVTNLTSVNANIAKLLPPAANETATHWMPYIFRRQTVSGSAQGNWPNPDGTASDQGSRENNGTLTHLGDGAYSYVYATNLATASVGGSPVGYERNRTHRVSIMMGGHAGATADANFDFVPDGSTAITTRDIVRTSTCQNCHGGEFHGHGGDRLTVENCATCHVPNTTDPHGGESLDLKVMVHKIHAGGDLPTIRGADGNVWDDPATVADESADNGHYAIWGNGNTKHEWWKAGFPAVHGNCNKCHDGSGADSSNWKTHPSRAACGSCHDDVNFATGQNHGPADLAIVDDNACHYCHGSVPGAGQTGSDISIPSVHNFAVADPRNVPEFVATLSVATPQGRNYFIKGESPVVKLVLTDKVTGQIVDHTTLIEDATGEGCLDTGCPPRDGALRTASLFVHGPRAERNPVLTSAARAFVRSSGVGPFDISASGASLQVTVDQGRALVKFDSSGADSVVPGTITVPVSGGTFASTAAATSAEIVAWLNANAQFAARAIAYPDAGRVAIRSRNLGTAFALQLGAGAVTTAVFGGDVAVHLAGFSNNVSKRTNSANNDPKVQWFTDRIEYTLDPVDDLLPGTYLVSIEFADRGRISDTNYKTPTVAKLPFQVKTATEELPIAGNCDTCHQAQNGEGLVFDAARHNKIFDDTAIDQCGACHDYQSSSVVGTSWGGAKPISKRVHSVHYGSSLNYPVATVDHADTVPGRAWDITFPQDVRNCETCHQSGKTSGTWATNPSRLACSGCHDSDSATGHMKLQVYDPTPADPFSGDEQETCNTCHANN